MKFTVVVLISIFFMANNYALSGPLDKLFGTGKEKKEKSNNSDEIVSCNNDNNLIEDGLNNIFGKPLDKIFGIEKKCPNKKVVKKNTSSSKSFSYRNDDPQNISIYTGQFDVKDAKGDDETSLFGIEHKNKDLFRDTWIGKFSPTTGGFVTGKNSVYLYTGIEADYNLGPIIISPSFAPGYYEAGDGKNLGSALEFKSEVKIGIDLLKGANLGYSYSHISNNDFGDINPGTDNQSINLSKKF